MCKLKLCECVAKRIDPPESNNQLQLIENIPIIMPMNNSIQSQIN